MCVQIRLVLKKHSYQTVCTGRESLEWLVAPHSMQAYPAPGFPPQPPQPPLQWPGQPGQSGSQPPAEELDPDALLEEKVC